jgi:hypothetical protein
MINKGSAPAVDAGAAASRRRYVPVGKLLDVR